MTSDILSHASKLSQVSTVVSRVGAIGKIGAFAPEKKRMSVNPTISSIAELTETENGYNSSKTPTSKVFMSPINMIQQKRLENIQIQDDILCAIASKKFTHAKNKKVEFDIDKQ